MYILIYIYSIYIHMSHTYEVILYSSHWKKTKLPWCAFEPMEHDPLQPLVRSFRPLWLGFCKAGLRTETPKVHPWHVKVWRGKAAICVWVTSIFWNFVYIGYEKGFLQLHLVNSSRNGKKHGKTPALKFKSPATCPGGRVHGFCSAAVGVGASLLVNAWLGFWVGHGKKYHGFFGGWWLANRCKWLPPPKFSSLPLKSYRAPIGKARLPTTMAFRGELLNFGGDNCFNDFFLKYDLINRIESGLWGSTCFLPLKAQKGKDHHGTARFKATVSQWFYQHSEGVKILSDAMPSTPRLELTLLRPSGEELMLSNWISSTYPAT